MVQRVGCVCSSALKGGDGLSWLGNDGCGLVYRLTRREWAVGTRNRGVPA